MVPDDGATRPLRRLATAAAGLVGGAILAVACLPFVLFWGSEHPLVSAGLGGFIGGTAWLLQMTARIAKPPGKGVWVGTLLLSTMVAALAWVGYRVAGDWLAPGNRGPAVVVGLFGFLGTYFGVGMWLAGSPSKGAKVGAAVGATLGGVVGLCGGFDATRHFQQEVGVRLLLGTLIGFSYAYLGALCGAISVHALGGLRNQGAQGS